MFMNVAPPGDQLVLDLGGALADFLFKIGHNRLRRRRLRPARGAERCENSGAKRKAHVSLHHPKFPGYPELETPTAAAGVACRGDWVTAAGLTRTDALLLVGSGEYVER